MSSQKLSESDVQERNGQKREDDQCISSLAIDKLAKKSKMDPLPCPPVTLSPDASQAKRGICEMDIDESVGDHTKSSLEQEEAPAGLSKEGTEGEYPTADIPLECVECCSVFDSLDSSKAHFSEVHDRVFEVPALDLLADQKPNPKCFVQRCSQSFSTISEARVHFASAHNRYPTVTVPCSTCGVIFRDLGKLSRHERGHIPPQRSCTVCSRTFEKQKGLRLHLKRVHGQATFESPALQIQPQLRTLRGLKFRYRLRPRVASQDPSTFKCCVTGCDLSFLTIPLAQSHLESAHGLIPAFLSPCLTCGLLFIHEKKFLRHQLMDHSLSFSCTICEAKFKVQKALRAHLKGTHGEEAYEADGIEARKWKHKHKDQPPPTLGTVGEEGTNTDLTCPVKGCELSFPSIPQAQAHLTSAHGLSSPFLSPCPTCGLLFVSPNKLIRHQLCGHTFNFSCTKPDCLTKFTRRGSVLAHIRAIHGQEAWESELTEEEKRRLLGPLKKSQPAFLCSCGSRFKTQKKLAAHRVMVYGVPCYQRSGQGGEVGAGSKTNPATDPGSNPDLKCAVPRCNMSFPTISEAQAHLTSAHPGTPTLACPTSGLLVTGKNRQNRPIFIAPADHPSNLTCPNCPRKCRTRIGVLDHIKDVHGEAAYEAQLTESEKRDNDRVKPSFVSICGCYCKNENALGVHEAKSQQVPCKAQGCGFVFCRKRKMLIHFGKSHRNSLESGPAQVEGLENPENLL